VNQELDQYRELADLARAALWAWDTPDRLREKTVALLSRTIEYELQELAPQVFQVLIDACSKEEDVSPCVIVLFRDAILEYGVERARILGEQFSWTRDLDDPESIAEGLRETIREFVLEGEVDAETAADLLQLLDQCTVESYDAYSAAELGRAVQAFASSLQEKKDWAKLISLGPVRQN